MENLSHPDPWTVYWCTSIPAGWFVFTESIRQSMPESDGFIVYGPIRTMLILDIVVFAFKSLVKLMFASIIGPFALIYAGICWGEDIAEIVRVIRKKRGRRSRKVQKAR
ncbi:hypothetical protein GCM10011571_35390 [Marinithermofilum abyssi]|uniref:Uncharacterized protein n=1 Tax=Marinithermofilum abyssi TaxID=1571185 RepID=A0A8J2VL32_9BACL|nr:hypothetical protein GCM10011571_35390 [Marinithermofilum abyssi]